MTVAMVITTAISLALLASGFLMTAMTERTKDMYVDHVEVMVQLDDKTSAADKDCSSKECSEIKKNLEANDGVEQVQFRNVQQSYEHFVQLFKDSDPRLVQETSPDAFPAALHVKLKDPTDTKPIDDVRSMKGVGNVVDQGDDVKAATDKMDAVRNAAFVIAAVQALAAVFLIGNMVQIAAFNRRHEISIMRMVGATNWFTQAPFVLEAVLAAIVGAVVAVVGMFATKVLVVDRALKSLYDARIIARITNADLWLASPVLVVLGAVVAALTAQIALRRYVKRQSD